MKYFLINNTKRKTYDELYATHLNLVDAVEEADAILVIGGDGSLLHAIAKYRELDKPFIGVHGGTRGYLMNNVETPEQCGIWKFMDAGGRHHHDQINHQGLCL